MHDLHSELVSQRRQNKSLPAAKHSHLQRSEVEQAAIDKEGAETPGQRLTEALIEVLTSSGIMGKAALSKAMEVIDSLGMQPLGPRIVARAWSDEEFKRQLLDNANEAIQSLDSLNLEKDRFSHVKVKRQWKEETIAAAQAQPWRPSWERKAFESTNNSSSTVDRCIVKPWRPSWEKDRPADSDPNRADRWQPSAVADLRRTLGRRIWASKQVSDMKQQLKNKHVVQCEDDTDALSQSDAKTSATTSLHSEAVGDMLSHDDLHSEQSYSETAQTAQESLHDILLKLKEDCERLSHEREWLFKAVRLAIKKIWCRSDFMTATVHRNAAAEALGQNFERMSLVGSVALKIDIPASDVDAVAFTKKPMDSVQALQATASILRNQEPNLCVQVIATARVPIMMASTSATLTVAALYTISISRFRPPTVPFAWTCR
eukprot:g4561.t1